MGASDWSGRTSLDLLGPVGLARNSANVMRQAGAQTLSSEGLR
jgi:hypothetical protein